MEKAKRVQFGTIDIKGMHCQSCAELIKNKLKGLNGVEKVKVNFIKEKALIWFNPAIINLDTLKREIEKMGYKASVSKEMTDVGNNVPKEKIIRIRLGKPNFLIILLVLTLILTSINLYLMANLSKKLTFFTPGNTAQINEQSTGRLREVGPLQESEQELEFLSRIEVSVDNDPVKGLEDAPVTIVEFSDFECPFCARFVKETLPKIEENYIKTGKVKFVFRDFPLPFHPNAQKAHEAAECAREQGKFWEYHDILFKNTQALSVSDLKNYANELGLDTIKFNECLDSGRKTEEVEKDLQDGQNYGVQGTPTFFINGIQIVGAQPYSVFEQIIEQELNK